MRTNITRWTVVVCSAVLLHVGGPSAEAVQEPPRQRQQETAKPSADISARCQAMMAEHEKAMADMKAADQRLDELVAKMNAASGQEKVDAIAAVVTEMVNQRKATRDAMMKMHEHMMSHMMEHMQAGPESLAACPMMKMGRMPHSRLRGQVRREPEPVREMTCGPWRCRHPTVGHASGGPTESGV